MARLRMQLILIGLLVSNMCLFLLLTMRMDGQRCKKNTVKATNIADGRSEGDDNQLGDPVRSPPHDARFGEFLRKFRRDIDEIGWFVDAELRKLQRSYSEAQLDKFIDRFHEQQRSAVADIESTWVNISKQHLTNTLTEKALKRIETSQNPTSCDRYLHCILPPSGVGSVLHHVVECLVTAHGTGRVARIGNSGSKDISSYMSQYDDVFLPLSHKCNGDVNFGDDAERWSESALTSKSRVVSFDHDAAYYVPGPFAPPSIPEDLAEEAEEVFDEADVWWTGCFVRYALRMREDVKMRVETSLARVDFSKPVVGLHIRRTDKIYSEASMHNLEEYMEHADAWYDVRGMMTSGNDVEITKKVYIASDEIQVFAEAKSKYPGYDVIEGSRNNLRNKDGLIAILTDIFALSKCDYVVCTFSSNVCRVVYELMVTVKAGAHRRIHSLDDIYQFSAARYVRAERNHRKDGAKELNIKVGDVIGVKGNHWDGYSLGQNMRTGETGLFPSYKASAVLNVVKKQKNRIQV